MTALRLPQRRGVRRPVAAAQPTPMQVPASGDQLRVVRQGYTAAVLVAALVQAMFFGTVEDNLLSTLLAVVSSVLGITFSLNSRRFRAQPISALVLLFYTTTATSGALLVKTIEWSPLAERLQVPLKTFSVLLATQVVLLVADRVYFRFQPLHAFRRLLTRRILVPMGVLKWPNDTQLWILGAFGCLSVIMTGTDYESGVSFGLASAGDKVFRAFGFLKYAPFLIPFRNGLSGIPSRPRLPILSLVAYFVALVGISFATNSRSTFADAVPTIGICVLIAVALGRIDFRRIPPGRLIMFGLAAAIGSILLSRVALAMVVVRDYRYNIDAQMLVKLTLEALFNNEWLAIAKSKMDATVNPGNYSESYVDSRFAARFLLTKYHDNILYYMSLFGADQVHQYREFMMDRLLATLPDPLLRPLGIAINKQDLVVSNGDYIVFISDGWGLGGFKTGSMIAEVFMIFGWTFPLVTLACALMLFVFHDAFATPTMHGRLAISPFILLLIWSLVGTTASFGLGAETVTAIPAGIVRGLTQNVLVYVLAIAVVRAISRLIGRGS